MKAEEKSLKFLGEGKQLTVPFFQRHYVWNERNWEELLESFESIDAMPFLGSIILKEASTFSCSEAIIIDGQQRLTTITILTKALYDSLPASCKGADSGIRNYVENYLFYRKYASDSFQESQIKIKHSRIDVTEYARIIASKMLNGYPEIDLNTISAVSSNIAKCYKYYRGIFVSRDETSLKTLFNSMFDDERKVFVLIRLEHNDINEQRIFDTINRAGVRLSTADIIKNNLFRCCLEKCNEVGKTQDDVCKLHDDCWASLFYGDDVSLKTWDAKRVFGNVERTNLEFVLYCVATIKWGKTKDIFSDLERVFNEKTAEFSYGELEQLIRDINSYAKLFRMWILDLQEELSSNETAPIIKYSDHVKRLLLILDRFGVQMFTRMH